MSVRRIISRLPDPVIRDLKSLVGQLARSRVFSPDGDAVTQEQAVALCIVVTGRMLGDKSPEQVREIAGPDVEEILSMYRKLKEGE